MANELISIANQFQGLPMQDLIGSPLNAAAEANAKMALTQTRFILNTGFTLDEVSKLYTPIMVKLKMTRPSLDENGNQALKEDGTRLPDVSFVFDLPLISIIPINSLAVQSVDINFEMEVKSSFDEKTSESSKTASKKEGSFEASLKVSCFSASVRGSVSYSSEDSKTHDTHYQKSNSAKYVVNVKAGQLPIPTGIATIIDVYSKNIIPQPAS